MKSERLLLRDARSLTFDASSFKMAETPQTRGNVFPCNKKITSGSRPYNPVNKREAYPVLINGLYLPYVAITWGNSVSEHNGCPISGLECWLVRHQPWFCSLFSWHCCLLLFVLFPFPC